ncbi:MAG: hypothetical protein IJ468_00720 [Lachnospiraceae bacterium]|nr:hypothetical protein [Lachnospiraceae bacterium]
MNSKERMLNAMKGKPVDRVPVTFFAHQPSGTAHINWVKNTGMDAIAIEPEGYYGIHRHWDAPLKTLDDFKKLRPFTKRDPYLAGQIDRAARVVDAIGDEKAVFTMLFTPFSMMKHTLQSETGIMDLWRENEKAFLQVMDVFEETNLAFLEGLKERSGLDGIFVSFQNAEKWRFTPDEYREILTPYDKRLLAAINAAYDYNIVHLCSWGNEPNNIELWRDYDYETVNWGVFQEENLSLLQGRTFFRPQTTVMGGFDRLKEGILYRGNREEIVQYTKNLIRETGRERLILSADCSVETDLPDEHIRWVVEAAEEYES